MPHWCSEETLGSTNFCGIRDQNSPQFWDQGSKIWVKIRDQRWKHIPRYDPEKWAVFFQIYPNAIHLNPLQFCPSMPLFGFPVFCLSSSIVLHRYFHILVNSMTIWSVLKLPKIAWPSPFKQTTTTTATSMPSIKRFNEQNNSCARAL